MENDPSQMVGMDMQDAEKESLIKVYDTFQFILFKDVKMFPNMSLFFRRFKEKMKRSKFLLKNSELWFKT